MLYKLKMCLLGLAIFASGLVSCYVGLKNVGMICEGPNCAALTEEDEGPDDGLHMCKRGHRLERHDSELEQGDVCRSTSSKRFVCPKPCQWVPQAPYCQGSSARVPCRVGRKIAIVLRTWREDCELGMQTLSSLIHVLPLEQHSFEIVVVTDEGSAKAVERSLKSAFRSGSLRPFDKETVQLVVEENFLENGHIQQKYSKLTADTLTDAEYIMHVDSDVFYSRWADLCFFGKDGRPRLDYDSWDRLPKMVKLWKNGSETLLNLSNVEYEFSRVNQHIYPRSLYKLLRERVEKVTSMPFKQVFTDYKLVGKSLEFKNGTNLLVSDFNLLGSAAHYLAPGLMWENYLLNNPALTSCSHQCNSRIQEATCCEAWFRAVLKFLKAEGNLRGFSCEKHFRDRALLPGCSAGLSSPCNAGFLR